MSTVLITGCSSGFGLEAALAFARSNYNVYATMRDLSRAQALGAAAEREGLTVHVKMLDVTRPDTFSGFLDALLDAAGSIDVLVNNAGILRAGAFEDLSETTVREVMETNFFGPMFLSRAVLPHMRRRRSGYIITVSSLSGIAGLPGDVAYSASKFAIEGAMEALRHEIDRWGIRTALVQAGLYATGIFDANLGATSELPANYPDNTPYRDLVAFKYREFVERLPQAADPRRIAELLVKIADSDGSRFRWQADELAVKVVDTMLGQNDSERDAYLRAISATDWWSEGKPCP